MQPRRAARDRRCVRGADALSDLLFELLDPGPEREPPGPQDLEDELFLPFVEPRPGERELGPGRSQSHRFVGETRKLGFPELRHVAAVPLDPAGSASRCPERWILPRA